MSYANKKIESSMALQLLLYFNMYYSVVWLASQISIFSWKVTQGLEAPVFSAIAIAVWALAEPFRLSFGWSGNLQEKVPQLTAFFLLTIIPQIAVMLYLLIAPQKTQIFQYALCGIMLGLFLIPQVVMGCITTHTLIDTQTQRFYMQIASAQIAENNNVGNKG